MDSAGFNFEKGNVMAKLIVQKRLPKPKQISVDQVWECVTRDGAWVVVRVETRSGWGGPKTRVAMRHQCGDHWDVWASSLTRGCTWNYLGDGSSAVLQEGECL